MEPLSAGAVALVGWLFGKIIDWTAEKALDAGASGVLRLIKSKLPTAKVAKVAALPQSERDDILEAELVQEVEQVAAENHELRTAIEAFGNYFQQVAEKNPEIKEKFAAYVQNCQGLIITGDNNTIDSPTIIHENKGINISGRAKIDKLIIQKDT
ncbi:MAG TPA: hypothetical protein VK203_29650 [Nostocaceae cyanobacterium]|nr:hypothetical protein [Nostocaceae cyanobacterium]